MEISHEEFITILNENEKYEKMKGKIISKKNDDFKKSQTVDDLHN